jgi:excinuclease ABC subunit A
MLRLEEAAAAFCSERVRALTVVQDRLRLASAARPRFVEACEHAYHFGKGSLRVQPLSPEGNLAEGSRFSNRLHCARCDLEYSEPSAALFSFNHPVGACPTCKGFGRIISIDYNRAIPDRSVTLAQGLVKPWASGQSAECQRDLLRMCRAMDIPVGIPFQDLPESQQKWVIEGDRDYGKDEEHQWPAMAGVQSLQNARASSVVAVPRLHHVPGVRGTPIPA